MNPHAMKMIETVKFAEESSFSTRRRYTKPDPQKRETATSLTARISNWTDAHGSFLFALGKFHDQGDAKWIVIRRSLWGHNDIGRPGAGRPLGVKGGFSYY
jgi:hypothetical protein